MKNKVISTMLVTCMLLSISFCGCQSSSVNEADLPPSNDSESIISKETDLPYNLPDAENYDGINIGLLSRDDGIFADELFVDNVNGEIVNDTIYHRNLNVQKELNVVFSNYRTPGDWNNKDGFITTVRADVQSNSGKYDIIAGYQYYMPSLIIENLFFDLKKIETLDLSNPWYISSLRNDLTINDKLYCLGGDLTLSVLKNAYVMLFNKTLIDQYQMSNPYELFENNEWTIDTVITMCSDAYIDLNGNGKYDNEDAYGIVQTGAGNYNAFLAGFNQNLIHAHDDGSLEIILYNDKTVAAAEKLMRMMYETPGCIGAKNNVFTDFNNQKNAFITDRVLFFMNTMAQLENFRDMESDFGVLPLPKWDSSQDGYYTTTGDTASLIFVPTTANNIDAVGSVLEYLSYESYENVIPAYYEVSMQNKILRDTTSFDMLNIIKAGIKYDMGRIYSTILSDINHWFGVLISDYDQDISSNWQKNVNKYESALTQLIEFYQ